MRAEDNADAPQTADDDTAEDRAEAVEGCVQPLDDVAYIDTYRSYYYQHHRYHDNQRQSGNQDQLQDLRNHLL